jgi:putative MFS transporter
MTSQSVLPAPEAAQIPDSKQSVGAAQTQKRPLTRNERLDRLPFNAAHRKLLVASGIGWAFDAMDVGLVSFVVAAIAADPHFALNNTERSWVLSIGFVGMAIGAALGGFMADRVGRKTVFTATLVIFGLANGAMAFAWSLAALLVARFVIGLGLGSELPVASTLVSEFAPTKHRGRMTVLLESFWAVGWIIAAAIGFFVIPGTGDWGWRWALLIGALPLLYAIVARMHIPESVRFLEAHGRDAEAEQAVRYFEAASSVAPVASPTGVPLPKIPTRTLFGKRYRGRTIAIWLTWFFVNFSYYGAFTWMPSLLADQFGSLTKSFGYTLAISLAQLPGYFLAAWLVEVWGRRKTLSIFLAVSAVAAFLFAQAGTPALVLVFGMLLSAANLGAWGVLYAVTPEIYPTRLRAAGSGAAAAVGRIAAIVAPLLVPWLLTIAGGGKTVAFIVFGAVFAFACLSALALPERAGKELEN